MTKNYIPDLIEDLEDMAGQYLSGVDGETLDSESAADDQCLYLLEVLGKIEPDTIGFKWTRNSWYNNHSKSRSEFEVKELPQGITEQELIYALIQMAKEYIAFGTNDYFTHSFMSAGEGTLRTLEELGYMTTKDKITYSLTSKPCFTLQDKIHKIEEICRYKGNLKTNKFLDLTSKFGERYYYLELCCKPLNPTQVEYTAYLLAGRRETGEFIDAEAESMTSLEEAIDNLLKCPELNLLEIRKKFSLGTN
jgi:hypothetical protein